MSGSINLAITTGADWATKMTWLDGIGDPVQFTSPVMEIRQELSPAGTLIASLDSSGTKDGTILRPSPGVLLLQIPKERTTTLQTGWGFWDIFVYVNDYRVRFAFGNISINSHITALTP